MIETRYHDSVNVLQALTAPAAASPFDRAEFQHVIDIDNVGLIDFGTGDQSYKAEWMEAVRPRFRIDCLDAGQPKAWLRLAKRMLDELWPSPRSEALAPALTHG